MQVIRALAKKLHSAMLKIRDNLSASVYVLSPSDRESTVFKPLAECAREIIDEGLGVEIFLSDFNYTDFTQDDIEKLKGLGQKTDKFTCHTHQFKWDLDGLTAEISFASDLGAKILIVHPATFGFERCDNPPSAQVLRDICKSAMDRGVRLAFENSGRTGIEMMRRAVDTVGPDLENIGMGICIDTGHANRSAHLDGFYAEDYLREFRELILEVHINDNLGGDDLHLVPGRGNIDWKAVIPELRALPDKAVLCIEIAPLDEEPMELIRQSVEFLCSYGLTGKGD